jgi:hypothetical protein
VPIGERKVNASIVAPKLLFQTASQPKSAQNTHKRINRADKTQRHDEQLYANARNAVPKFLLLRLLLEKHVLIANSLTTIKRKNSMFNQNKYAVIIRSGTPASFSWSKVNSEGLDCVTAVNIAEDYEKRHAKAIILEWGESLVFKMPTDWHFTKLLDCEEN